MTNDDDRHHREPEHPGDPVDPDPGVPERSMMEMLGVLDEMAREVIRFRQALVKIADLDPKGGRLFGLRYADALERAQEIAHAALIWTPPL